MCRGESSCILPIAPKAIHRNETGSRRAIRHFTEYLERFPDDQGARWLLNVAHMTLGEFPSNVEPRFVVSIDHFLKSAFDIGRFRDIGDRAKVNRFNMAGGADITANQAIEVTEGNAQFRVIPRKAVTIKWASGS
jgi:hypothetical protein